MKIDADFCRRIERSEARGLRGAILHARNAFPGRGLQVFEIAGATVCYAGVDSPLSQTLGLGLESETTDADLTAIIDVYHSRGAAARIVTSPIAGETLSRLLQRRGFTIDEYVSTLVADLRKIPGERDQRIDICTNRELWAEYSARGFNDGVLPPEPHAFIARIIASDPAVIPLALREGDEIVTTGSLALEPGGIAALFGTSTMPSARGKGHQPALIRDRVHRASAAGATIARAGANPASTSERNFRRCGFQVLYTRTEWMLAVKRSR